MVPHFVLLQGDDLFLLGGCMKYDKNLYEVAITDGEIDLITPKGFEYDNDFFFDIALHNTTILIGEINYEDKYREVDYMGNVGYSIFKDYRGNHYATKALNLLKELLIKAEKNEIVLSIAPDNKASQNTAKNFGAVHICDRQIPKNNVLCKMIDKPTVMIYTYNLKGSKKK